MINNLFQNFISLIYPENCACCGRDLFRTEESICMICESELPFTKFHDIEDNPVEKKFYGKFEYHAATAFLYFSKKGIVQQILHELKYGNNINIGIKIGELFGKELQKTKRFTTFDYLIPVPLHPKKERKRGYNQSLKITEGMNKVLQTNVSTKNLIRKIANPTQTKKNRWQRWENVSSIFQVEDKKKLEHKKILLIDDVITTGATIEACVQALSRIKGIEISIACLALPLN